MKTSKIYTRLTILLLLSALMFRANAANRYWVGGSSASWAVTSSWSSTLGGAGGSSVPGSSDVVFFDGSDISSTGGTQTGAVTVSAVPTVTIQRLVVLNSANFTLTATGNRTMTIGGGTGTDLDIGSGCTISLGDASNRIALTVSASNTGTVAGTLIMANTGGTINFNSCAINFANGGILRTDYSTYSNFDGVVFENGSTYESTRNSARIPLVSRWEPQSTVLITGYTSTTTAPTNITQLFGNITWNCPSQTVAALLNSAMEVAGDFTVVSTGSGSVVLASSGARNLVIRGDFNITGGTFDLSSGTSTRNGTINLRGDLNMSGGTLTETGSSSASGITFDSTATQTFSKSAGTISNVFSFTVASGAIVQFDNVLDGTGPTFTNNGTMVIGHDGGITTSGSSGQIQVSGTRTYSTSGNYSYTGGASQVFGAGLPATVNNLTVSNGNTGMLLGATTINGTLTIGSGSTVDMGTNALTCGGSFATSGTGVLKTQNTSGTPFSTGETWSMEVQYNSASTQTVVTGTYANLTCANASTKSLGGDVTVNGTLSLSGSAKIGVGANTLTLNGGFSGSASNCIVGSTLSNLTIGGTGSMGNLFFEQTGASDTALNDLVINRSGETITLGSKLKLFGTLTPTAGTLQSGGNLILVSNAGGTADIAPGSGSVSGNVTVQRFIPSSARRWRFLSSPVTSATLADWQGEIHITGTGGAANGFDASPSNQAGVYTYNETVTTGDLNTGWTAATNITNSLTPGTGFRVFVRGTRDAGRLNGSVTTQDAVTLNVVGTVNSGNVSMPVTFSSSGNAANDGWCLLGNPYPSAIDWNAFHDNGRSGVSPDFSGADYSHLDGIVYVYDASANNYVSYNAISNAGTLSNGLIPSGAAFFVQAAAGSPAMTMKETYKSSSAPSNYFKNSYADKDFKIRLIRDSISWDDMIVKFVDEAAYTREQYDIPKLWGPEVNIASLAGVSSYLTLDAKPFPGKTDTTRLSVRGTTAGNYTIRFSNAAEFAKELPLTLMDRYLNTTVNLRTQTDYTFAIDPSNNQTFGDNRFLLVVGEMPVTTIPEDTTEEGHCSKVYLYPSPTTGPVTIVTNLDHIRKSKVEIRRNRGRIVEEFNNPQWEGGKLKLDLTGYEDGLYLITIRIGRQKHITLKCILINQ